MLEMKDLTKGKLRKMLKEINSMSQEEIYSNFGNKYDVQSPKIDCEEGKRRGCDARCCYFFFGLSPQDINEGIVEFSNKFPFMIKQQQDGSCVHLNMKNLTCKIWENRPETCRRYTCKNDPRIGIFRE